MTASATILNYGLDGAVVLVTGACGGIGREVCVAFAQAGSIVVGTSRRDPTQEVPLSAWFPHDVTSEEDWTRVIARIGEDFGRLDCLVNSAGISMVESIATLTIEQLRRVMSANVESVLLGMQASLALLKETGCRRVGGASIVNISSVAGLRGVALNAAYSASKGALTLLSKSAAKEFALLKYPIRVNTLHPSPVATGMMDSILASYNRLGASSASEAELARNASSTQRPWNRMAAPEEVAGGVLFLCSYAASYMTGSELVIDGGISA